MKTYYGAYYDGDMTLLAPREAESVPQFLEEHYIPHIKSIHQMFDGTWCVKFNYSDAFAHVAVIE